MKEGVAGEFFRRIRVSGVVFRHFEFLQTCNAIWEENKLLEPSLLLSHAPHVTSSRCRKHGGLAATFELVYFFNEAII